MKRRFFIIRQERGSEKQTHANDGGVEKNDEDISLFVISFVFLYPLGLLAFTFVKPLVAFYLLLWSTISEIIEVK